MSTKHLTLLTLLPLLALAQTGLAMPLLPLPPHFKNGCRTTGTCNGLTRLECGTGANMGILYTQKNKNNQDMLVSGCLAQSCTKPAPAQWTCALPANAPEKK